LEARVGFSCVGILRYLVRKGLLASIIGKKKVVGYKLGAQWPAVRVLRVWFGWICVCDSHVVHVLPQRVDRTSLSPDWVGRHPDHLVAGL
jgi:hypothetical protein